MRVMLDLETLDTGGNACIVSVGACTFDCETPREFYMPVDYESHAKIGGTISASTFKWWLGQSENARNELIRGPREDIHQVLTDLALWLRGASEIWGNGSDFDNVILASAYRAANTSPPWKFFQNRCFRTLKNTFPMVRLDNTGTAHNAIDDARNQARLAEKIFEVIRKSRSAYEMQLK